jgi:hypothetical protein
MYIYSTHRVSNGYEYPLGMDKVSYRGYGYDYNFIPIDYTGMDIVLSYPAHTLPYPLPSLTMEV